MKKLCVIMCFCICFVFSTMIAVVAYQVYNTESIEVVFAENSMFTNDEKNRIEKYFSGDDVTETYGLKCILFGHDYKTEYVDVITHKVLATRPRCKDELYETQICTVCSDTVSTLIASEYIDCCQ